MNTISAATWQRWGGRLRRQVGAGLRICATLWLVFYIVYTPLHLYGTPHWDGEEFTQGSPHTLCGTHSFILDDHDDDAHHSRHSALQHKFKVTQSLRLAKVEMLPVTTAADTVRHVLPPQLQGFGFSGLSPPELHCGWQFFFRAALPGRAPCLPS